MSAGDGPSESSEPAKECDSSEPALAAKCAEEAAAASAAQSDRLSLPANFGLFNRLHELSRCDPHSKARVLRIYKLSCDLRDAFERVQLTQQTESRSAGPAASGATREQTGTQEPVEEAVDAGSGSRSKELSGSADSATCTTPNAPNVLEFLFLALFPKLETGNLSSVLREI